MFCRSSGAYSVQDDGCLVNGPMGGELDEPSPHQGSGARPGGAPGPSPHHLISTTSLAVQYFCVPPTKANAARADIYRLFLTPIVCVPTQILRNGRRMQYSHPVLSPWFDTHPVTLQAKSLLGRKLGSCLYLKTLNDITDIIMGTLSLTFIVDLDDAIQKVLALRNADVAEKISLGWAKVSSKVSPGKEGERAVNMSRDIESGGVAT
eukprot:gene20059-26778_t